MEQRDRLIEIIQSSVGGCARNWAEVISDGLIENGYRKQSDVAREIFEEIEKIIRKHDERPKYSLMIDIAELKKKYTEGEI